MLTTSQVSSRLKSALGKRKRANELNEYASQLGLKENYINFGCSKFYLWTETDVQRLKLLIANENE